jgi:preprotein translocase subunit YajC
MLNMCVSRNKQYLFINVYIVLLFGILKLEIIKRNKEKGKQRRKKNTKIKKEESCGCYYYYFCIKI